MSADAGAGLLFIGVIMLTIGSVLLIRPPGEAPRFMPGIAVVLVGLAICFAPIVLCKGA